MLRRQRKDSSKRKISSAVSNTASSANSLRAFRLRKAKHQIYDTKSAELFCGRWNSKGTAVLYVSESRALSVLELLVHLTAEVPNKYVLGSAEFTQEFVETIDESSLGPSWKAMLSAEQSITRTIGDEWVRRQSSAVLSLPSVIVGERNFVLNPAHKDYASIVFSTPQPFELDTRLLAERARIQTK